MTLPLPVSEAAASQNIRLFDAVFMSQHLRHICRVVLICLFLHGTDVRFWSKKCLPFLEVERWMALFFIW